MTELLSLAKPDYSKLRIALIWRLQGARMYKALAAFDLAEEYSLGKMRKDGITPEFQHQVRIALHAFTLKDVNDQKLDLLIATILLHDLMEDYDVEEYVIVKVINQAAQITNSQYTGNDGYLVHQAVWAMTKTYQGVKKSAESVFEAIAQNELASLAKGLDRINNFQSMVGVFTLEKRIAYVQEGLKYFLPMLKKARKKFSHHVDAYLNIETVLKYQIEMLDVINDTEYVEQINSTGAPK